MPASSTSFENRSTAATPAKVVGGVFASLQQVALKQIALTSQHASPQRSLASHASSERQPYSSSALHWASMISQWATSAARCAAISANAGSIAQAARAVAPRGHGSHGAGADTGAGGNGEEATPRRIDRRVCGWRAMHAISSGHLGFASFVARVRGGADAVTSPRLAFSAAWSSSG